jgi:hypothetical protein
MVVGLDNLVCHLTTHITLTIVSITHIRVIHKVRKTQHQNPEFGHKWVRWKKNLKKSTLAFKGRLQLSKPPISVVNWVSSYLSFFLSACTAATYIFTAPTCTSNVITLEPCALNAEFQHFITRFNKIALPLKERFEVKGGPKTGWRQGDFTDGVF